MKCGYINFFKIFDVLKKCTIICLFHLNIKHNLPIKPKKILPLMHVLKNMLFLDIKFVTWVRIGAGRISCILRYFAIMSTLVVCASHRNVGFIIAGQCWCPLRTNKAERRLVVSAINDGTVSAYTARGRGAKRKNRLLTEHRRKFMRQITWIRGKTYGKSTNIFHAIYRNNLIIS